MKVIKVLSFIVCVYINTGYAMTTVQRTRSMLSSPSTRQTVRYTGPYRQQRLQQVSSTPRYITTRSIETPVFSSTQTPAAATGMLGFFNKLWVNAYQQWENTRNAWKDGTTYIKTQRLFTSIQAYANTIKEKGIDTLFLINFARYVNSNKEILNERLHDTHILDIFIGIFMPDINAEVQNLHRAQDMPTVMSILIKAGAQPTEKSKQIIQALYTKIQTALTSSNIEPNTKAQLSELKSMCEIIVPELKPKHPPLISEKLIPRVDVRLERE